MRRGTRIGVDPGGSRIGVARSDPDGVLATPVETLKRGQGDLRAIRDLVRESGAVEVVVGLPRSLNGSEGPAAAKARAYAGKIARMVDPIPVRMCDERLTTVTATAMLRDRGTTGSAQRAVVDQAAATVILQAALDAERATGTPPGELVSGADPHASDDDGKSG